MGAEAGGTHRTMDECPVSTDPSGQQGRILVFRRHNLSVTLERLEVLGEGERHARAGLRVGRENNGVFP